MKKFEHIIHIAQNTKAVSLPDGFTEKVMENLPPGSHTYGSKLRGILLLPLQHLNVRSWVEVETVVECAVCFLMVGFFYFTMGVVMALGLKTMGGQPHVSEWIMIQPQIAFASAIVFIFLGIFLLKKRMFAIKLAYGATILYIGFSVFNSAGIQMATGNPFSAGGMLCLTSGAVVLGIFLAVIVHKYSEIMLMENF